MRTTDAAPDTNSRPGPESGDRYLKPAWFDRHVMNPLVRGLTNLGISVMGSRELRIVGRRSGKVRTTVVNLLGHDGHRYLVAPRGVTAWVRNLRASGAGELRVGRRVEAFSAVEIPDAEKVTVLRAYLDRWGWEVGKFFPGVTKRSSDEDLAAIAPDFPVFRVETGRDDR